MIQTMLIPLDELPKGFPSTGQSLVNQRLVGWRVHDVRPVRRPTTGRSSQDLPGRVRRSRVAATDCSGRTGYEATEAVWPHSLGGRVEALDFFLSPHPGLARIIHGLQVTRSVSEGVPTLFGTRVAGGVIIHTSLARFLRRARRELLSANGHTELTEDAGRIVAGGGEQRC